MMKDIIEVVTAAYLTGMLSGIFLVFLVDKKL